MTAPRRSTFAAALTVLWLAAGCESKHPEYMVTGQVQINGQPAGGVYVVFTPTGDPELKVSSATRSRDDGSFAWHLTLPGEHAVTAFWPEVHVSEDETTEGKDRLRGKFRDPRQPVLKVEIVEGENQLPLLELNSK